ncbi:uncharacterized protein LOC144169331 [Haemaphysalis longicornis]
MLWNVFSSRQLCSCCGVAVPARADSNESLNIVGFRGIRRAHCNPAVIFSAPWHNRLLGGRCGKFGNPKGGNAMECLLLTATLQLLGWIVSKSWHPKNV